MLEPHTSTFAWDFMPKLPLLVTSQDLKNALSDFTTKVMQSQSMLALRIGLGDRYELPDFVRRLALKVDAQPELVNANPRGNLRIQELLRQERPGAKPIIVVNGEGLTDETLTLLCAKYATDDKLTPPFVLIVTSLTPEGLVERGKWRTAFVKTIRAQMQIPPLSARQGDWAPLIRSIVEAKFDRNTSPSEIKQVTDLFAMNPASTGELITLTLKVASAKKDEAAENGKQTPKVGPRSQRRALETRASS